MTKCSMQSMSAMPVAASVMACKCLFEILAKASPDGLAATEPGKSAAEHGGFEHLLHVGS